MHCYRKYPWSAPWETQSDPKEDPGRNNPLQMSSCLGESHGERSLTPIVHRVAVESDTTKVTWHMYHLSERVIQTWIKLVTQRNKNNEESLLRWLNAYLWSHGIRAMKGWYDSQTNHNQHEQYEEFHSRDCIKQWTSSHVTGHAEDSNKHKFLHFTHTTYTEIQNYITWKIKLLCFYHIKLVSLTATTLR